MDNFPRWELETVDYERAAELLETKGWGQGLYVNEGSGDMCLVGALRQAMCERLGLRELPVDSVHWFTAVRDTGVPRVVARGRRGHLIVWNDTPGRTKEEVMDLLTSAAKTRRDEGR